MATNTTDLRVLRVVAALALVTLVATSGWAQSQFMQVITVTVQPGAAGTFEEQMKKVNEAANKANIPQEWACFEVDMGRPGLTYLFATGFDKWAETDAWMPIPEFLTKAFGEEETAKILRAWGPTFATVQTVVNETFPDLSTHPKDFDNVASHYRVIRTEVKPDMDGEYRRFLAKVKAAQEKTGAVTWIRRASAVGTLSTFTAVRRFEKYAELDAGKPFREMLADMYGDEEAREMWEDSLRCVAKREIYDLLLRPDLSRSVSVSTTN